MNWEKSRALTPLKRDFLYAFFERESRFFLTGGTALGVFYLDHRRSYDIDLFTTADTLEWHLVENEIRAVGEELGATVAFISRSPEFMRCSFERREEREIIDFVRERVPQIDETKTVFGGIRVDTLREIGVNKICTLVSRCERKDILDLYFLHNSGFDISEHFAEAQKKEGGLDPAIVSHLLADIRFDEIPEYVIESVSPSQLNSFMEQLRDQMAALSFPEEEGER